MSEAYWNVIKEGSAVDVGRMLEADPDLIRSADPLGKTGLHWAAELDRVDVARTLIDAGADIEAKTTWGASPFDWAAVMGSTGVAEVLQARGAGGLTLITAASLGYRDRVRNMVESGEDLSRHRRRDAPEQPHDEWPADTAHLKGDVLSDALYAAARNGHVEVAAYLLSRGADVNAKGFFGATGIHWAAINGHFEMVDFLVMKGADLNIKDARFDAYPDEWAREGGYTELADELERRRRGG